jgi:predicted kinase
MKESKPCAVMPPALYVFSGLPGTGKTTLSRRLARRLSAAHLRIDTLEQGVRDLCGIVVESEGYELAYRLAADNLRLGISVVADSCNPIALTRNEWETVARDAQARCVNIEVICSDPFEHRRRIETRRSTVVGLVLPTWEDVLRREYHDWTSERSIIDTAHKAEDLCFEELLSALEKQVPEIY